MKANKGTKNRHRELEKLKADIPSFSYSSTHFIFLQRRAD